MIKSQFLYHSLSYARGECNKSPHDITEEMQFFQPPLRLLQPLPLIYFQTFSNLPSIATPPSIPEWRVIIIQNGAAPPLVHRSSSVVFLIRVVFRKLSNSLAKTATSSSMFLP